MYKHILLPTDGSELSEKAIMKGLEFAKKVNARVTGFYAVPESSSEYFFQDWRRSGEAKSPAQFDKALKKMAEKHLAVIENAAKKKGVRCKCFYVCSDSPHEAIIKAATDKGCDLIFMASHGKKGIGGMLLGSQAIKVLMNCKIPVLVYR